MPPKQPSPTWRVVNDFSPGIHQILSPNHPPGSAQEVNTYRCHSVQGGALAPLPGLVNTYYHEEPSVAPATPADLASEEYRVIGIHVNDPVFWGNGEGYPGKYQNNSEIYVALEWWDSKNGGHVNWRVDRYFRNYLATPHWETIWTTQENQTFSPLVRPKRCEFVTQRSNYGHRLTLGPTVLAWCLAGWLRQFPDETDQFTLSTVALPGDHSLPEGAIVGPDGIVAHQGRIVVFPLNLSGMGPGNVYTNSEAFYWSVANSLRELGTTPYLDETLATVVNQYFTSAVFTEDPTGYNVYQSLSADELLLIKARQGAVILRGSLDDFTATNYPFVRGTGFSMNRGANSPKGFVYPTDGGGVWLWSGGEFSEHLTKQLEQNFWRPDTVAPAQGEQTETQYGWGYTKCDQWNQFVMFPNNWLWDTDFDGWWRIDNTDSFVIHKWATDWRGINCYGTPSGFRNISDPCFYEFNKIIPASSYSWQSHPLQDTVDRECRLRELVLVATGSGKVYVTVSSAQNPTGQRVQYDIDEDFRPHIQTADFDVHGSHITIRLESESLNDSDPAPVIHEFRYRAESGSQFESVE